MSRIRLLASDLDGTFLKSDGRISDRNRIAVAHAREKGLRVVFATGRPARWLRGVAETIDHYDVMIGGNGAFVADMSQMQVVHRTEVDFTQANAAIQRVLEKHPDATFAVERSFVGMPIAPSNGLAYDELRVSKLSDGEFAVTPGYVGDWKLDPSIPVMNIDDLLKQPDITKIIVRPGRPDDWNADTWLAEIGPMLSDLLQVTHASQEMALVELSAIGVTKAAAVAWLAEQMGIGPEQVVAVGDMPNDISLLNWAGEAWTVSNGHPEVQAVTDRRLPSNEDDAVAHLIADLLSR